MANHKQQLITMLDEAGINYRHTEGDSIVVHGLHLRFHIDGRLREAVNTHYNEEDFEF